ncbi:hypothetical protein [Coleofasciculus sp. F4-SAH-05]|uniref:hypothetical protein n=1 Tax=Coleofasciculus sp. F4-SAH-05 TaxID=3069525 RepID=UPI0032F80024
MTFSPDYDSHKPQQEFDSPFLSETIFTDEAADQAAQALETRQTNLELESPFLEAFSFEPGTEDFVEPRGEEEEEFDHELEQAEFDEEVEEEAFAELWTDQEEELELEPEVQWKRSEFAQEVEEEEPEPEANWEHFSENDHEELYENEEESYYTELDNQEGDLELEESETFLEEIEENKNEYFTEELELEDLNYELELEDYETLEEELKVYASPTPGRFYRIKKGDSLLKIAGKAYGVGSGKRRLAFAQYINAQILNQKYLTKGKSNFVKKNFPDGIISFYPKFSCDAEKLIKAEGTPPKGKCFAVIWIPPKRYSYHPILGKGRSISISSLQKENGVEEELEKDLEVRGKPRIKGVSEAETTKPPFRWICSLGVFFIDPDDFSKVISFGTLQTGIPEGLKGSATGLLVGSRHVLTAAHVVNSWISGSKGTPLVMKAKYVRVTPAQHGNKRPFGSFLAAKRGKEAYFEVPKNFRPFTGVSSPFSGASHLWSDPKVIHSLLLQNDYALIKLTEDVDEKKLGWWNSRSYLNISEILGQDIEQYSKSKNVIKLSGYPTLSTDDLKYFVKKGTIDPKSAISFVQIFSQGEVNGTYGSNVFSHDALAWFGHSGSPIWKKIGRFNSLVGIQSSISQDRDKNYAVLITHKILDQIQKWKKSMGGI